MTIDNSIHILNSKISHLRDDLRNLATTAGQDAPAPVAQVSALSDSIGDILSTVEEAVQIVLSIESDSSSAISPTLAQIEQRLTRAFSLFFLHINSLRFREIARGDEARGKEWMAWKMTVDGGIERCAHSFIDANESLHDCWVEISGPANQPSPRSDPRSSAAPLAYAQHVFDNYMEWYKTADAKAQLILGLDGAFLTFLTGSAFAKGKDVTDMLHKFGVETWILLSLMCAAMAISMFSALACLWSRVYKEREIAALVSPMTQRSGRKKSYSADVMWFFQMVHALKKDVFEHRSGPHDRPARYPGAGQPDL